MWSSLAGAQPEGLQSPRYVLFLDFGVVLRKFVSFAAFPGVQSLIVRVGGSKSLIFLHSDEPIALASCWTH